MKKTLFFLSILLSISIFFALGGTSTTARPNLMSSANRVNSAREISFLPQATAEPPIPIPTIVIPTIVVNPAPPSNNGFMGLITPLTILVFVLVGAIILIALVAVIRRPAS